MLIDPETMERRRLRQLMKLSNADLREAAGGSLPSISFDHTTEPWFKQIEDLKLEKSTPISIRVGDVLFDKVTFAWSPDGFSFRISATEQRLREVDQLLNGAAHQFEMVFDERYSLTSKCFCRQWTEDDGMLSVQFIGSDVATLARTPPKDARGY